MEAVTPKVHHHRRRSSGSRQRQQQRRSEEQQEQNQQQLQQQDEKEEEEIAGQERPEPQQSFETIQDNERISLSCEDIINAPIGADRGIVERMSRATSAGTTTSTISQSSSQQTVLLVNGETPPQSIEEIVSNIDPITIVVVDSTEVTEKKLNDDKAQTVEVIEKQSNVGGNSSRHSSGDAQSLKETLQQLRPSKKISNSSGAGSANASASAQQHRSHHHHHHHHHRERERDRQHRMRSSRETSATGSANSANGGVGGGSVGASGGVNGGERVGILGFMEREMRQCSPTPSAGRSNGASAGSGAGGTAGGTRKVPSSLSDDPQASPAQRSIRSRSSLEKSPRRKRSKSESRRRRERKLIAAGEMEVRQANETLMRYLKQCSEMNDASLSGELEIDQSYDERRVHRKTKSQRDKRGHLISKLYTAGGGLSSLLKELSDDIVPAEGEEIYNPFTPVVSPTEDNAPAHIDKMFMQTSSGYRPVERCFYKHHHHHANGGASANGGTGGGGGGGGEALGLAIAGNGNGPGTIMNNGIAAFIGPNARGRHFFSVGGTAGVGGGNASIGSLRLNDSYGDDIHCLLEGDECNRNEIRTNIQLACFVQRIWLLIANICHGILAGLALAHLLFVLSSPHPIDWANVLISQMTMVSEELATTIVTHSPDSGISIGSSSGNNNSENASNASSIGMSVTAVISHEIISDYASFAGIYLNTFYCLAIICMVSVLDRMDICRWDLTNASELISFRWLIIAMIYIATIILTICSDTIDDKLFFNNNNNITITEKELLSNSVLNIWSSLSVTRSISAIFGWIMIGLSPHEDLLYEHLVDLTKYQFTNN